MVKSADDIIASLMATSAKPASARVRYFDPSTKRFGQSKVVSYMVAESTMAALSHTHPTWRVWLEEPDDDDEAGGEKATA